ncbi:MAG: ComF family protein [Porticoccaceae bacterium]
MGDKEVSIFSTAASKLCHFLLPNLCTLCREYLDSNQHSICSDCTAELPWLNNQCQHCAIPLAGNIICPECQQRPPIFRRCIAPLQYQQPINRLIKPLKTDINAPEFRQLSRYLANTVRDTYKSGNTPQVLVPMPLHWRTLARRGYNQSYIIAKQLCAILGQSAVASNSLYRHRYSKPQHLQTKRDRLRSMVNAFGVRHSHAIKGIKLALIDDVVTTGATAQSAAACLVNAGALSVDIWCIARTGWHNNPT